MSEVIANREDLLASRPTMIAVDLPDMGKTINVLKGTWSTLQAIEKMGEDTKNIPHQIALILCDPDGQRMITTPEDIEKLGSILSLKDMVHIMQVWQEANGIAEGAKEELTKNSETGPIAASA